MADTKLPVFNNDAQTAYIDMRTEATNGEGRQVVVLGDPSINANVATVATQDLGGSDQTTPGVVFRLAGSAAVQVVGSSGTLGVHVQSTGGTLIVKLDPDSTLGGIRNSVAVHLGSTGGTIGVRVGQVDGTLAVYYDRPPSVKKDAASTGSYGRTAINAGVRQIIASSSTRKSVVLVHDSPNTVYIGLDNSITSAVTGTAFPLVANQIFGFDDYTGAIFGTTESGEAIIKYIQI